MLTGPGFFWGGTCRLVHMYSVRLGYQEYKINTQVQRERERDFSYMSMRARMYTINITVQLSSNNNIIYMLVALNQFTACVSRQQCHILIIA